MATGYLFTEASIDELKEKGFDFIEGAPSEGCRIFSIPLGGSSGFQFHVVLDEEAYRRSHQVEHFYPFLSEHENKSAMAQKNSVYGIQEVLTRKNIEPGPLHNYLLIRKPGKIWALHLKCQDFDLFCQMAKPDKIFTWQEKPAALIHLGPTSFDLVVT